MTRHAPVPPAAVPAPSEQEPMVGYLERDQLVSATLRPVPRAPLSRRTQASLWLLRAFVIVVGTMVIYTFISRL